MFDPGAPTSQRILLELEDPEVRARLHKMAFVRTESDVAAEDLVEDALVRVLDPEDSPWQPSRGSFLLHMKWVMRQTWTAKQRRAYVKREIPDGGVIAEEGTPGAGALGDEALEGSRWLAVRVALLEQVVAALEPEHPIVRPICELGAQGVDVPSDQAQRLGCSVQAVYEAFATLKRHARKALNDWDRGERRRMMTAQAVATTPSTDSAEEKEVTP